MRVRDAIADAAARLSSDTPRLDAELLAAHLLGVDRSELLLRRLDDPIDVTAYAALVARRCAHEPLAYITGHREFWSLDFVVTSDVLIPRPDTETLIEAAVARTSATASPRILDLGTGSGCLLLAALAQWPSGWGVGVDRSEAAARIAQLNARRLGLAQRAAIIVADWAEAVAGCFDLVFSNPPYIASGTMLPADVGHEPAAALFAGQDGLDDYRRIIPQLVALLHRGGWAHLEIGAEQADLVIELGMAAGLVAELASDLAGRPRCVSLRRP